MVFMEQATESITSPDVEALEALRSSEDETVGPYNPAGPTDNAGGASTFTDPKLAPLTGQYHALPAGTELPFGLGAIADGEDAGGPNPMRHVTIYPTVPMTFAEFQFLFHSLPWQWVGKK